MGIKALIEFFYPPLPMSSLFERKVISSPGLVIRMYRKQLEDQLTLAERELATAWSDYWVAQDNIDRIKEAIAAFSKEAT